MSAAALLVLVAVMAVSFWRPLKRVRRAVGLAHLLASGYAFVLVGLAAGLAFDLAREPALLEGLGPILVFAAGWVGFAAGSRFEARVLRTVPGRAFARALAPAAIAALLVGVAGTLVLGLAGAPPGQAYAGGLILAAAGASAGPTLAAILRTRRARRVRDAAAMLRMIEFSAGIADGLVIVLGLLAFILFPAGSSPSSPMLLLALAVGGGAVLGVALWLFTGADSGDDERLLLGLGMLAMVAGLGGWLEVAPTALAAVTGAVVANLPGGRSRVVLDAVRRVERPVVIILMTIAGVYVSGGLIWQVGLLLIAITALRLLAKIAGAGPPSSSVGGTSTLATPRSWTLGLTPQGILGLVIAVNFFHVWRDDIARAVLAAVALGGLVNELLGPVLLTRVFRRLGGSRGGSR